MTIWYGINYIFHYISQNSEWSSFIDLLVGLFEAEYLAVRVKNPKTEVNKLKKFTRAAGSQVIRKSSKK